MIIATRQTFLSLFFNYLRAVQWAIISPALSPACVKDNADWPHHIHFAQAFYTEINEDARLINARVNALTRQISLAKGYE